MDQKKQISVLPLLLLSSIFCWSTPTYSADTKKAELQQINNELQKMQQDLHQQLQKQNDLQEQLKTIELSLAAISEEVTRITALQSNEQQKLSQLKQQEQLTKSKLEQQHAALAQQVRASYEMGKLYGIKILLNGESTNTVSRHVNYYRYLAEGKLKLINDIKNDLLTLNTTMQAIAEHQLALQSLLDQKQQQQKKLEIAQTSRRQLINSVKQNVQTQQIQYSMLLENQKALQEALNQIALQASSITNATPFMALQGKLHWPVQGSLLANFGSSLDVGDGHLSGVIIKAPMGTPVHAVSSGKVIFANWLRGFGLLIIINHGNGYMSLYARNGNLYAKIGEQVQAGDVISTIGNTGGQELSSLYFEIRQNGIPVNPSLWCRYT